MKRYLFLVLNFVFVFLFSQQDSLQLSFKEKEIQTSLMDSLHEVREIDGIRLRVEEKSAHIIPKNKNAKIEYDSIYETGGITIKRFNIIGNNSLPNQILESNRTSYQDEYDEYIDEELPTIDTSKSVGEINGNLTVSLTGGAVYDIDLDIPNTIGTLKPNISLAYNSQGTYGVVGYGWNLMGISYIERVHKTIYHDGENEDILYSSDDVFALDGIRLKETTTAGVYVTETHSNLKIVRDGIENSDVTSFTVYHPDGTRYVYGTNGNKTSLKYYLTKVIDVNGNEIDYEYESYGEDLTIKKIIYGKSHDGTKFNEILFTYTTGFLGKRQYYHNGNSYVVNKLLTSIETSGDIHYKYDFELYLTSLDELILKKIKKFNVDDEELNSIQFEYGEEEERQITRVGQFDNIIPSSLFNWHDDNHDFDDLVLGDFEWMSQDSFITKKRDGGNQFNLFSSLNSNLNIGWEVEVEYDDVLACKAKNAVGSVNTYSDAIITAKQNENGSFTIKTLFKAAYGLVLQYTITASIEFTDDKALKYYALDINKDMLQEIVVVMESGALFSIKLDPNDLNQTAEYIGNIGVGFDEDDHDLFFGNVTGNGSMDVVLFKSNKVQVYKQINSHYQLVSENTEIRYNKSGGQTILSGDYNGDGLIDFMKPKSTYTNTRYWDYIFSNGSNNLTILFNERSEVRFNKTYYNSGNMYDYQYLPIDINKDGKTDFVKYKQVANDFNDSGRTDRVEILVYENKNINSSGAIVFNEGYHFTEYITNENFQMFGAAFFLDVTSANDRSELVVLSHSKMNVYDLKFNFNEELRLSKIVNSKGKVNRIIYSDLGYNDEYAPIYSSSSGLEYPYIELKSLPGFEVVNTIIERTHNVTREQHFRYHGAVTHVNGLGFLGFKGISRSNFYNSSSERIWRTTLHDPILRGAIISEYTQLHPSFNSFSTAKTQKTYTYQVGNLFQGADILAVYPSRIIYEDRLSGLTSQEDYEYNTFFDITKQTITKGSLIKETTYNYFNNFGGISSNYYTSRMNREIVKSSYNGVTLYSMNIFIYTNNKLSKLRKYNNNAYKYSYLEERYSYDDYGNLETKTINTHNSLDCQNCTNVTLTESWEYSIDGRKIIKHINNQGIITKNEYDDYGNKKKEIQVYDAANETSPHNKYTEYEYDKWGNVTSIIDSDNNEHIITTEWLNNYGEYKITSTNNSLPDEIDYFDTLNRKYKTETESLNGSMVAVDTEYNHIDQVYRTSEPYFSSGSPTLWTTNVYDRYGRNTTKTLPTEKVITTSFQPLITTVEDGTHTKVSYLNSSGFVRQMRDDGGDIYYTHYPNGIEKTVTYPYMGQTISISIDGWGRKSQLEDPSAGTYQYKYDLFGNIIKEILPSGTKTYNYDNMLKLQSIEVVGDNTNTRTTYTYDDPQLRVTQKQVEDIENGINYIITHEYNGFNLLKSTETNTAFTVYIENQYGYGDFNRNDYVKTIINTPNDVNDIVEYSKEYDNNGILKKIINSGLTIWEANEANQRGLITKTTFGNGVVKNNTYDAYGLPTREIAYKLLNSIISNSYGFNAREGLLDNRKIDGHSESFGYDGLNRLTTINGTVTHSYDNSGRITNNYQAGNYIYNSSDRYKVSSINLNTNGNSYYTNHALQNLTYNVYKAPVQISEQGHGKIDFRYIEGQRSFMYYGGEQVTPISRRFMKFYANIAPVEIIKDNHTGKIKLITYINGNPYNAEVVKVKEQRIHGSVFINELFYIHKDYLGNYQAITNSQGNMVEKARYGAWGIVENFTSIYSGSNFNEFSLLGRGFTGHEHLFSVGLIHMNGRLYDPVLNRFLMPDNYIQDPTNTQNFNRYAYAYNNPLAYTDQSGEFLNFLFGAAIGVLVNGINNLFHHQPFFRGAGTAAIVGGIGGYFANAIGTAASNMSGLGKIAFQFAAHGHVNGVLSGLTGGSYGTAFISSGMGSFTASVTGSILISNNSSWRAISMVANGGLASGLTNRAMGGNFWEGFRMGTITAGLNHLQHQIMVRYRIDGYLKQKGINPEGKISLFHRTEKGILSLIRKITPLGFDYIGAGEPEIFVSPDEYGTGKDFSDANAHYSHSEHLITVFQSILNTNYRAFTLTLGHEIQHALHHVSGIYDNWVNHNGSRWALSETEIRAYQWQIDYTGGSIPAPWFPASTSYPRSYLNYRAMQQHYINKQ